MGTKHQSSSDHVSDNKKKRRVGFAKPDEGIEPNQCIQVFLVSSKEEVDSPNSFKIEPVDLSPFFEEDGKIYGYKNLKITVWLSSVSFHSYADISFESKSDGGKGITDLKSCLQDIFAENLLEKKEDFLQTFSTECDCIKSIVSSAEALPKNANTSSAQSSSNPKEEPVDVEVFKVSGTGVGDIYSRLVPLVLLLIDGSNPIDVTDPRWEIFTVVQKATQDSGIRLLGLAAVYRFYRYPDTTRLRLGQILVIPPYQRKGYGSILLQVINNVATSDNVYDLTIEEPVDSLQHVRTCIDVQRLLAFEPVTQSLDPIVSEFKKKSQPYRLVPPTNIIEDVRKNLKINRRQFLQCWEILIYLSLNPIEEYLESYTTIIMNRVKTDVIGKESEETGKRVVDIPTEFDQDMSFSMFKSPDGGSTAIEKEENQDNQEEQLKVLVEERMKVVKMVAEKVSSSRG